MRATDRYSPDFAAGLSRYAVFRTYSYKPGCVDYLGSVFSPSLSDAEKDARALYGKDAGESLDVHIDDE